MRVRSRVLSVAVSSCFVLTFSIAGAAPPPSPPVTSTATRTITLADAKRMAARLAPRLQQARAVAEAARARVSQARAGLYPQVNANAAYQRSTANFAPRPGAVPREIEGSDSGSSFTTYDYWSFGLNVSERVWDFGQTTGRANAAEASAEAEEAARRSAEQDVVLGVETAYIEARARKELLAVARETLVNQERHLSQIQSFVEVGTRPEIDLAQARTDVANARVQLITAETDFDTARADLNNAIGAEGPIDFDVADERLPPVEGEDLSSAALIEEALRARPEISALERRLRSIELTIGAIEGEYGPVLGVSTGLTDAGRTLDALAWNWNAAVSLSWPIFEGGLTVARLREARANVVGAVGRLEEARQGVRLEIERARSSVRASKAAIEAAAEAVTNARERLRLAEGRYEAGVGSAIELGDAQLALTAALAQRVQADHRLSIARAGLKRALGRSDEAHTSRPG